MATIIPSSTFFSGSPLIGSPIVYKVQAGSYSSPVFHRVKLQVVAALNTDTDYTTIEMSSPAEEGEYLLFDISSALRAVADKYEYTAEPPSGGYPYLMYYLVAWDEYMLNGVDHESSKDYYPDNYTTSKFGALMGKYTDMERLLADGNKQTQKFTRKPSTQPEIVVAGETYIRPAEMSVHSGNITQGQQAQSFVISSEGAQTAGGASLYALPATTPDCYQLRFINGLGCMESLCVRSFITTEVPITTNEYTRAVQETFSSFSRGMTTKQNDYERYRMTSGPLDNAWMSWYIHEFLMARWVWLKIKAVKNDATVDLWVPCHVIPDETVAAHNTIDRKKQEVQFTLKLDIEGSPMSAVAI